MAPTPHLLRTALAGLLLVALAGPVLRAAPADAAPAPLVGTFTLTAGTCDAGAPAGSYLRMILPTGTRTGPFLSNGDSACSDQTFTLLAPGTDGGLVTGDYQPNPVPAFDDAGNGVARRITEPTGFFGVQFSTSTNPVDPQTGLQAPAPSITLDGTSLTGDLTAFAASWNDQEFNQGAPKPNGTTPGNTALAAGTFDPATGAFTLEWASQVEGGPFDRFTGLWHLEGRFVPAAGQPGTGGSPAAAAPSATDPAAATGEATDATGPADTTAATETSQAPASTVAGRPDEAAAADAAATAASTRTVAGDDGWAPPSWLVVLVAALGLAAFAAYVGLERAVRRIEVSR